MRKGGETDQVPRQDRVLDETFQEGQLDEVGIVGALATVPVGLGYTDVPIDRLTGCCRGKSAELSDDVGQRTEGDRVVNSVSCDAVRAITVAGRI